MKHIILILASILSLNLYSQNINYDNMTFTQLKQLNRNLYNNYILLDSAAKIMASISSNYMVIDKKSEIIYKDIADNLNILYNDIDNRELKDIILFIAKDIYTIRDYYNDAYKVKNADRLPSLIDKLGY